MALETDRPTTSLQSYPGADLREWAYEGAGLFRHQCGASHVEPTLLGIVTFRSGPYCDDCPTVSPFVARALAGILPAKVLR